MLWYGVEWYSPVKGLKGERACGLPAKNEKHLGACCVPKASHEQEPHAMDPLASVPKWPPVEQRNATKGGGEETAFLG